MAQRYEWHSNPEIEVVPRETEVGDAHVDEDFALLIGNPYATAFVIENDAESLLAWLEEAADAVRAAAGTAKDLPKIEVLVIRDPDSADDVTLFVDGEPVSATYEHVDPGAGYEIEDWREHTASVQGNAEYSEGFKRAVVSARDAAESSSYIEGDKRPVWTFFGHWENDRIVIDMHLPGVHEDTRVEDYDRWPEGLWCDTGHGDTVEEAEADARNGYYEADEEDAS